MEPEAIAKGCFNAKYKPPGPLWKHDPSVTLIEAFFQV